MAEKSFACPDCEKTFASPGRLAAHRRLAPDHNRPPSKTGEAKPALNPDAILDLAVENIRNDAALIAPFAPHFGVVLHGIEDGRPDHKGEWVVESRAILLGKLLRARVQKDMRLVAFLTAFNRLHETPDALKLLGLPMAVAVDTGRLAPDAVIELPLFGRQLKIPAVKLLIGDAVEYVEAELGKSPTQEPSATNGSVGAPEVVTGGVEAT